MLLLLLRATLARATINVVQMGDSHSVKTYRKHVQTVEHLCQIMRYNYSLVPWNKTGCPFTAKVATLDDHLNRVAAAGDWVAWVDLDAQYQNPRCDAWWHALPTTAPSGEPCHFTVLKTNRTLNTGVVHVRATPDARALVRAWLHEQVARGYCGGPADQMSLQTVMMRAADATYDGRCEKAMDPSAQNECFHETFAAPPRHVCLLSCTSGLQGHDCAHEPHARRGENLFLHLSDFEARRHSKKHRFNHSVGLCAAPPDVGRP